MRWWVLVILGFVLSGQAVRAQQVPRGVKLDGVPPIPKGIDDELNQYRFDHVVSFEGWLAEHRAVLYLQLWGGTLQVFLNTGDDEPIRLTSLDAPIKAAVSHPARERLILSLDPVGDEHDQLLLFDLVGHDARPLTGRNCRSRYPLWSNSGVQLAFSSDARDEKAMDVYVVNPPRKDSDRLLLKTEGRSYARAWSPDDRRLAIVEYLPGTDGSRIHLVEVRSGKDDVLELPSAGPVKVDDLSWTEDGKGLFWLWNDRSEFTRLVRYDLASRAVSTLTAEIPWDIEEYSISGDGRTIAVLANEDGWSKPHLIDSKTGVERAVRGLADGYYANLQFRPGTQELAFQWSCAQVPRGIYSYDLESKRKTEWVRPRPASDRAGRAAEPELIRYPSFDGRMIPAFVRKPSRGGRGRPPYPVLISIHGGPARQYRPAFSSYDDFLLQELGIALVCPNVRGSTGYGRSYEKLDDGKLRENAVKDIGALLDWIATQPDLDSGRVAVAGGSYGGYMALASLAAYGDRLQAGIDDSGFSSHVSSLQTASPGVITALRREYGDERDPEMADYLRRISPLTNADKIRRPLLVVHGAQDSRVSINESDQLVRAVKQNGVPVWYIRFENEGHNWSHGKAATFEDQAQVLFLMRYLLGEMPPPEAEPAEDPLSRALKRAGQPQPIRGRPPGAKSVPRRPPGR